MENEETAFDRNLKEKQNMLIMVTAGQAAVVERGKEWRKKNAR